jgi:acyl-CoA reductase-like NAD-dependent aldehyde dehydrogenase
LVGGDAKATFFLAMVITEVGPGMRGWKEESFGLAAPLMTFADDEAIAIANDTEYGLAAGVSRTACAQAWCTSATRP